MITPAGKRKSMNFYSPRRGMGIMVNPGQQVYSQGQLQRIGTKEVFFTPLGDYGYLTTEDAEVQEYILAEIARGNGDFLTADQYNHAIKTPEMRENEAQQLANKAKGESDELRRELERKNDLIAKLRQQGKA